MTDPADREIAKTDLGKKMKEFDDQIAAEKNRQGQGGTAPQNAGGKPWTPPQGLPDLKTGNGGKPIPDGAVWQVNGQTVAVVKNGQWGQP